MSPQPNANILWFLPTHGDGRYLGTATGGREVNFNYLRQIAQAADQLGYYGVLLPTGRSCEDSWVVASAVAPWTERLRYLVAVRPGLQSPAVAARMTATLDRVSNGRLLINVVTGGDPVEIYGMTDDELFRRVIFPGALPSIFVGLRFALGIMWLTLIVAETIPGIAQIVR